MNNVNDSQQLIDSVAYALFYLGIALGKENKVYEFNTITELPDGEDSIKVNSFLTRSYDIGKTVQYPRHFISQHVMKELKDLRLIEIDTYNPEYHETNYRVTQLGLKMIRFSTSTDEQVQEWTESDNKKMLERQNRQGEYNGVMEWLKPYSSLMSENPSLIDVLGLLILVKPVLDELILGSKITIHAQRPVEVREVEIKFDFGKGK
jgi:hypothetical protein